MSSSHSHRVSCTNCCVVGCHNNYANTDKSVKFYSFPSKPHEKEKRLKWIGAVKRKRSESNKPWEPKLHSRICSQHFIGNSKSNHPQSPSYIPTIFPKIYTKQPANVEEKTERMNRFIKRQKTSVDVSTDSDQVHQIGLKPESDLNVVTNIKQSDFSTQANIGIVSDCSFVFECEYQPNNEVGIYCNIPQSNNMKQFAEKSVGSAEAEICAGFHGINSLTTDEQLVSLSSVQFSVFTLLANFLNNTDHGNDRLTLKNKLLLFLMKIKLGISYIALGVLFGINRTTAQRTFTSILEELVQKMQNFVFWPSKEVIMKCLPKAFKVNYPNCRVIIDCTEIKIQQPSTVDNRIFTYSQYKGTFTAKFLIGITPNGFISFISKCYGGRASDAFITNDSGLLTLLEPGDLILADKGFPGIQCKEETILVMPPFVHNGHLTIEEVEKTYGIASVRIHVERAIQRVKLHGILNNFTNDLLPNIDDIVFITCALSNLQPPIIKL